MAGMLVGYARTSTADQIAGLAEQLKVLEDHGCEKLYQEQTSATGDRPELANAILYVREGDTLVCKTLDRLARSVADLLLIIDQLEKKGVSLRILDFGGQSLDTKAPTSKLILTMMGAIAEFEKRLMLERQRIGIAKAKRDGKYKGREPTARQQTDKVLAFHAQGVKPKGIADSLRISRASVFRILKDATSRTQSHQVAETVSNNSSPE